MTSSAVPGKGKQEGLSPGVLVLRNIPHGFYEEQMLRYFSQFGEVLKLRMSRSRKTGKSRGYAYVEFAVDEVAKIAAETMDNYLMFEHLLKCQYIPPEKVHPKMFSEWNNRQVNTVSRHKAMVNGLHTCENERKLVKKRLQAIRRTEKRLKQLGIAFRCILVNKPLQMEPKNMLVIDSSDDEIKFKTPPNAKKTRAKKTTQTLEVVTIKPRVCKLTTKTCVKSKKSLMLPKLSILRAATKRSSL